MKTVLFTSFFFSKKNNNQTKTELCLPVPQGFGKALTKY